MSWHRCRCCQLTFAGVFRHLLWIFGVVSGATLTVVGQIWLKVLIIDVLDQWRSHNQNSVELDDFAADDLEERQLKADIGKPN